MRTMTRIAGAVSALALAAACSPLPERIETLDQARSAVTELEQDPLTRDVAPDRFETAQQALSRAEAAFEESEELELIEHEAYVALRNAQIAQQQIEERRARDELEQGEAERNRLLLQAREREAQRAGEVAAQRGERLETQSEVLEEQSRLLEQQTQEAQQAQQRAQELEQQTEQLEQQLAELEAQETERGWVLTLEDVLFDFDAAELNPGAGATMDRIAQFLAAHPDRNIVIEGHTDSSGSADYNQQLSARRAEAVRQALVGRGVEQSRIEITALGEEYPIATNQSVAGRQLNRRVELVLSEEDGEFAGEQRTASADPAEEQG